MTHKVLFVDDEPNVLDGLRRILHHEKYEILTASSAGEAIKILNESPVDIVMADQEMPGMTGTELLSKVKEMYPDTVRYILTGKATLDVAIQAINEGSISRFFTKPCKEIDLRFSIRQALEHKDLIVEAKRLLKTVRKQNVILDDLEESHPGITQVKRDRQGTVIIDDDPTDAYKLLNEIRQELEKGK